MADLNYDVSANTTGAIRSLDALNNKVLGLNKTFAAFKTVLGGAVIGNFVRQTLALADSLQDLSDATGISTKTILEFQAAVQQNGGTAENAQAAMNRLALSIGEATEGSKNAQYAFEQVGLSLKDLKTLSQEEILLQVVKGLDQITDSGKRAVVSNELVGKSLRGVSLRGLADALAKGGNISGFNASAIKSAADAQDKLATASLNAKLALVDITEPLTKFTSQLNLSVQAMKSLFYALGAIAVAFAAVKLDKWLVTFLTVRLYTDQLSNAMKFLGGILLRVGGILSRFILPITAVILALEALSQIFFKFSIIDWVIEKLGKLGDLLAEYIPDSILIRLKQFKEYLKDIVGMGEFDKPLIIMGEGAMAAPAGFKSLDEYFRLTRQARSKAAQNDAWAKEANAIREITAAYAKQNEELLRSIHNQGLELDVSSDQIEIYNAAVDISKRASDEIERLVQQRQNLKEEDQKLIPVINAQIAAIRNRAQADTATTTEALQNLQARRLAVEKDRMQRERESSAEQDNLQIQRLQQQLALIGQYGVELERNTAILEITNELQDKLVGYQNDLRELESRRTQIGEERYQAELDHINQLIQKAYELAGIRIDLETKVLDAQREAYKNWQGALKEQFEELAKSVTPAQLAVDTFGRVIDTIDSAITDFVQKGKFSFKDFASSILKDMAMIIARALVMRAILAVVGAISPTAGAALGNILGGARANGGPVTPGKAYIVGEEGMELFLPKTAGNIIPNNQLAMAGGGGTTQVTYNINAVDASSFRSMIARDPQFIYNVTEVGRRSSPSRRLA